MLVFPLDTGWTESGAIYCAPSGSDGASGTSPFEPKLTGYAGALALQALGGGTLYMETTTSWGGPVAGQGAWFEQTGLGTPGFVQVAHGMTVKMRGRLGDAQVFQRDSLGALRVQTAPGAGRRFPGIWVKSLSTRLTFENIVPVSPADALLDCPWRLGIDYMRKSDHTTLDITVTNASRAAGSTTLTVTLPTYTITNASRTGTTVTIRVTVTSVQFHDWVVGQLVKVTSTDGNFPSGDFTVLSVTAAGTAAGLGFADITYTQAGAATTGTNIGTMGAHGVIVGEWVDLFSSSSKFPSSMYRCTSVPASNQIVVEDIYGYSPRSASDSDTNIGTLVHQVRSAGVANLTIINCGLQCGGWQGGLDDFKSGPACDVGSSNATSLLLDSCLVNGYLPPSGTSNAHRQADRCAGVYADPGTGLGSAVEMYRCSGSDGGIRLRVGLTRASTDQAVARSCLFDTSTGFAPPLIEVVEPNPSTGAIIDLCEIADNDQTIPIGRAVSSTRCDPNRFKITRSALQAISPVDWPGYVDYGPGNAWGAGQLPSPWTKRQYGFYAGGRIAGRHPGHNRAMGPVAAPYANKFLANTASWTVPGGVTVNSSTDAAPDGSASAYKMTGTGLVTVTANPISLTCAVGGRLVVGAWIKGAYTDVPLIFGPSSGGVTFNDGKSNASGAVDIISTAGWQWFAFDATIATVSSPLNVIGQYSVAGVAYLWGATFVYVPETVDNDEYAEWFGTFKHQPAYLPVGMSGTMEGQKFVAHGGLATAKRYTIGGGAGQITLGAAASQAIEVFDEAGNSIGVIQPNTFTLH